MSRFGADGEHYLRHFVDREGVGGDGENTMRREVCAGGVREV